MSLSYKDLKHDWQWKATVGMSEKDFVTLRTAFGKAYETKQGVSLEQAAANLTQEFALSGYEECLFFVLFQLKNGLTQDCLGPVFGMDGSSAWRNFQKYLPVLELALKQEQALPKRQFKSVQEFVKYLHQEKEITLDVSEYAVERPADKEKQKQAYSGKKRHTRKSLFITGKKKRILYVSSLYHGSCRDYEILKRCFAPTEEWFKKMIVRLDLGFQGFADLYNCKKVFIPVKKKRVKKGCSNELSDNQKQMNKEQAQQRVGIEHSIGGMKRYRILSNRLRLKSTKFMDSIIGVCAGLWNFLTNKPNQLITNLH